MKCIYLGIQIDAMEGAMTTRIDFRPVSDNFHKLWLPTSVGKCRVLLMKSDIRTGTTGWYTGT